MDHFRPFGPFSTIWTILDHFRPFWPFLAILTIFGDFDHFLPFFWNETIAIHEEDGIFHHFSLFWAILDHFDHFDHFWPFLTIFWQFLTIVGIFYFNFLILHHKKERTKITSLILPQSYNLTFWYSISCCLLFFDYISITRDHNFYMKSHLYSDLCTYWHLILNHTSARWTLLKKSLSEFLLFPLAAEVYHCEQLDNSVLHPSGTNI